MDNKSRILDFISTHSDVDNLEIAMSLQIPLKLVDEILEILEEENQIQIF